MHCLPGGGRRSENGGAAFIERLMVVGHYASEVPGCEVKGYYAPVQTADIKIISDVDHPPHYQGSIECIAAIAAALTPDELAGFIKGNVIKYTWRSLHKGGNKDLEKAKWYLNWYLEHQNKPLSSNIQ
jgi:Protein of unknwon function (DUF3310)